MSESMGIDFRIGKVRLAFPLDLAVHDVLATEQGDTLLEARALRLDVQLLPLLEGRAEVDGVELYNVKLNTKSYVADTRIVGHAKELTAAAHSIDWKQERVNLNRVALKDADFLVVLSDTAQQDTTTSTARWIIDVEKADIIRSQVALRLPGDSMRIGAKIGTAALRGGHFDTGLGDYAVRSLRLRQSELSYDLPHEKPAEGLDANHLAVTDLQLALDTLTFTHQGVLRAGLRRLALKEKCGLDVDRLQGSIYMDTTRLVLPALCLRTPHSQVDAEVDFDFRSLAAGKGGHCRRHVDARLGKEDVVCLGKGYVDAEYLNTLPATPITLKADVEGNMDHLRLPELRLHLPGTAKLEARGYAAHVLQNGRSGHFALNLSTQNLAPVRNMLPRETRQTVTVPDGLSARGTGGLPRGLFPGRPDGGRGTGPPDGQSANELAFGGVWSHGSIGTISFEQFCERHELVALHGPAACLGQGFRRDVAPYLALGQGGH